MASKRLTREQILNVKDLKTEDVLIPEWGGYVTVKAMTGTERDAFEGSIIDQKKKGMSTNFDNIRSKLVQKTVVDEEGKPLFTVGDVEALGSKSASSLQRIFEIAQKLAGLKEEDIEELEKN